MSSKTPFDSGGHDLAAEYALGVLTGRDREVARARFAGDEQFRTDVERWTSRLSPMLEEVRPAEPPKRLWAAIEAATGGGGSNVIALKRRVNVWRGVSAGMTALAASLAIVLVQPSPQTPIAPASTPTPTTAATSAAPLIAMVSDKSEAMTLVANWDPKDRQLVLALAGDMPVDRGRAHELWVIPPGGAPKSLGTMAEGRTMHMELADTLAELLRQGATIAISVEPPGGSPTGAPTGPVIASGTLESS